MRKEEQEGKKRAERKKKGKKEGRTISLPIEFLKNTVFC